MMQLRFKRYRALAIGAAVAAAAVPTQAFACWEKCVAAHGTFKQFYGSWYRLDHCVETWPDGATAPRTSSQANKARGRHSAGPADLFSARGGIFREPGGTRCAPSARLGSHLHQNCWGRLNFDPASDGLVRG
jgi:hypothetical protein